MKKSQIITAILILDGCGASGVSLAERAIYSVPDEVSLDDARLLVRMGKAEAVDIGSDEAAEKEAAEKEAAEKEAAEKEAAEKEAAEKEAAEKEAAEKEAAEKEAAGKSAGKNGK